MLAARQNRRELVLRLLLFCGNGLVIGQVMLLCTGLLTQFAAHAECRIVENGFAHKGPPREIICCEAQVQGFAGENARVGDAGFSSAPETCPSRSRNLWRFSTGMGTRLAI